MSIVPQSGEGLGPYLRRVLGSMVTSVRTSGNVQARIDGNTLSISVPTQAQNKPFFAKITSGSSGTGAYSWIEQWQTNATTFADLPNGRSGTFSSNPACEINKSVLVPIGAIVVIYPSRPSDNGPTIYQFDYLCSAFVAEITGSSFTAYSWEEQVQGGVGAWSTLSGGRSGTTLINPAYEINLSRSVPAGTLVWMYQGPGFYWFVCPNVFFPVTVQQSGGSNGTVSTPASYTYDVTSLTGAALGSAVPLARPRPNGAVIYQSGSAGYGVAFYDGLTLKLWDAGEVPDTDACVE